jgi:hypothetical protein
MWQLVVEIPWRRHTRFFGKEIRSRFLCISNKPGADDVRQLRRWLLAGTAAHGTLFE